jgi:transposase-like protein
MDDGFKRQQFAVMCPYCEKIHHGVEVTFSGENDFGHWVVECKSCGKDFVAEVKNPCESGGAMNPRSNQHWKSRLQAIDQSSL